MTPNTNPIQRQCRSMILVSVLLALAACDRTTPIMASSKSSNTTGISAQKTSAYTQFSDIPIPSGADINVEKTLIFGSKPWFGQLSLDTSANAGTMFDFYRNNLPQYDWQELTSVRAPTSILTYDSEDRILVISIQGSTIRGSEITLTVSPKGSSSPPASGGAGPAPIQLTQ